MSRIPHDFTAADYEHERRFARSEFLGGYCLGFMWGAGFMLLLMLWIDAGGAP